MTTTGVTIDELLRTTSRTFALSIPLLPQPLNREITLAYLIFRIADTVEDADFLERDARKRGLDEFCEVLETLKREAIAEWTGRWASRDISRNADYNRLMRETPMVLGMVAGLPATSRRIITGHAIRSAAGMSEVLANADEKGNLQLTSVQELRDYCYFVAGIVGELITELFVTGRYEHEDTASLLDHAASFGEALQLVNILKDSDDDKVCGRAYLPAGIPTEEVFTLARQDLERAERYVQALRDLKAPPGFIAFCDAPLQLASATLRVVAEHGPGSKVPRDETLELLQQAIEKAGISG